VDTSDVRTKEVRINHIEKEDSFARMSLLRVIENKTPLNDVESHNPLEVKEQVLSKSVEV